MAVRAMSATNTETIMRNYVMNIPCSIPAASVRGMLLDTAYLQVAAREWSATHIISEWTCTNFSAATDAAAAQYIQQYSIPHDVLHAHAQYVSQIVLPNVLAPLLNTHVSLHINKHVYVTRSAMFTVTEITGLPVLGECVIYSRHAVNVNNQIDSIHSRNTATYPAVPWYLKIVQPVIEQKLRDSMERQTWAMARAWCGQSLL